MPVPEDVRALFEAARWAASSYNEQPWRFVVVQNVMVRYQLAAAAFNNPLVRSAPVFDEQGAVQLASGITCG